MNLVDKLCKELGVRAGESWLGSDGVRYTIGLFGQILQFDADGYVIMSGYDRWAEIFAGDLKPVWEPEEGEFYFTPNLQLSCEEKLFNMWKWQKNSPSSKWHNKLGIIYRTEEEAVAVANKIIELIKEERQNG